MDIRNLADNIQPQIVAWYRDLHRIPEVGLDLPRTAQYVCEALSAMGIPYTATPGCSGIVATITGGNPGKTLALRADMDALPITEEAPVDFASANGNMHACGHDAHVAMLLGAAKILSEHKAELGGSVRLIFQPGEEGLGGAAPMIEAGCLEGVEAIFGQHIGCLFPEIGGSGKIIVSHGSAMASCDSFKIKITGHGTHGALPETGIDPISAAAQVINGIYMIKAREVSALDSCVISVCMIHGGSAGNIIPQEVELEGTVRCVSASTRDFIESRVEEVVRGICAATRTTYELLYERKYDITQNDPAMADAIIRAAKSLDLGDNVIAQRHPLMGSEDMSFYLGRVPGAYYFLSSVVRQSGQVYGHHNSKFMLDESVFARGAALFVQLVVEYLNT